MNAPCPHHCPPGSGRGSSGPLAVLVLVLVTVAVLAGPLAHAATEALSAVIEVVEIAALTVGSAAAVAVLVTMAALAHRARTRHRRADPALIARPIRAPIAAPARVSLTPRASRPLPGHPSTSHPGTADGYRQPARLRLVQRPAVITTWRTDDPCPVCGTGLHSTGDGTAVVRQDCPLCGWSATWHTPDGR